MTREEAILWMQVLKHSKINWVGEQAEDEDIIARCEESEQEAFDMAISALQADAEESYLKAYYDGYNTASIEAQKVIADFGKVVRCKDCRYWTSYGNCTRWTDDTHDQAYTNANDFCSYGERREG